MNFLGHLYFSGDHLPLMAANLLGDFIKGKNLTHLQPITQQGVLLHRTIDDYFDHHPEVLNLAHSLYEHLPKVTGIAIDLMFDHLLARNWSRFHSKPLPMYIEEIYRFLATDIPDSTEEFNWVMNKMIEGNWLGNYPQLHGLQNASYGLSRRISFPNELAKTPQVFIEHQFHIEHAFENYMRTAIPYFISYRNELKHID